MTDDIKVNTKEEVQLTPEELERAKKEQHFDLENKHVLGGMDFLSKRLRAASKLLQKRIEQISLVYDDDTFQLDRFRDVTPENIKVMKKSIEGFPKKNVKEFIDKMDKAYKLVNELHRIIGKK